MEKFRFGLNEKGTALKELLNKREICIKSGNPVDVIDAELSNKYGELLLDPKLAVKLAVLEVKPSITDEEKGQRDEIYALQATFRPTSPVVDMVEKISEMLKGKTVRVARISKKVEQFPRKKEDRVMSYLPGDLRSLYDLKNLTVQNLPTSILRAIVEEKKLDVTGETVLNISFVSVFCDKYSGNYEQHLWSVTYDVKDAPALTTEEVKTFANVEEELA